MMKVYVTTYALSTGIQMVETEGPDKNNNIYKKHKSRNKGRFYSKANWHATYPEAVKRGEEMRAKKIASLRRQIKKFEGINIEMAK